MSTPPRARSRRGEGERLREALLAAAGELLDESRDLDQLSVRAVTARAGVSPTALYLHFADKDELRRAIKKRCLGELGASMHAAASGHEGDPRAQLRAMGGAYLRYARDHPGHYALLFHMQHLTAETDPRDEAVQAAGLTVFAGLVDLVRACVSSAEPGSTEPSSTEPVELATLFWMALHGRAALRPSMPWFPFTEEERYVALLVRQCVGESE